MADPIKIMMIEPVGGHGGMDLYNYGLALGLAANGASVILCTSEETKLRQLESVETRFTFKNVWSTSNKLLRLYFYLSGFSKAFLIAKKDKLKAVHIQFFDLNLRNLLVLILAKLFRLRVVLTLHDIRSFHQRSLPFIEKMCLSLTCAILVHNTTSEELLRKKYAKREIHVIPHGSYVDFVKPVPRPTETSVFNVLFFGQIKAVKGLDMLLQAFQLAHKRNPQLRLTIAGKPWKTDIAQYESSIAELGISEVTQRNYTYIPNEEVSSYYANAHLVVLPYREIYQSGVLLLTMSFGTVAIASDLPAFKEFIREGETGFLFKANNPEDLADKIIDLASGRHDLKAIRENALQAMNTTYSWKSIAPQFINVYAACL